VFIPEATNTTLFAKDLIQDSVIYKVSKLYLLWVVLGLLLPTLIGRIITKTFIGSVSGFLWGTAADIFNVTFYI